MIPHAELHERQRLEDLRDFRKYLVETGTVKGLVKLYKHIFKHEMRLDNPELLKQFLGAYQEPAEGTQESEVLAQENAGLRECNDDLSKQAEELGRQVREQQRLGVARAIWRALSSREFWEGPHGGQLQGGDVTSKEMTFDQIYQRLCGRQVDPVTGIVFVDCVRPPALREAASTLVTCEAFCAWVAREMTQDMYEMLREDFLPRLNSTPLPRDPPFEAELLQAIRECALYPESLDEVAEVVELDQTLYYFLSAAAERFAGSSGLPTM